MLSKSIKITTTGEPTLADTQQKSPRFSGKDTKVPLPSEITLTSIDRNSTWVILDSLWQDYVEKWRRKLDPNGLGKEAHQNRISKNMAQLEKDVQKGKFYSEFQVTDSPNPNTTFTSLLWISSAYMIGTLYVTDNFICFRSTDPFSETYRLVIAWINITKLEPVNSLMGLADNAIKVQTRYGNEFTFCIPQNRDAVWLLMQRTWTGRLFYKERMIKNLSSVTTMASPGFGYNSSYLSHSPVRSDSEEDIPLSERNKEDRDGKDKEKELANKRKRRGEDSVLPPLRLGDDGIEDEVLAWALDVEMTSTPRFQQVEDAKMEIWSDYFGDYGVMMEPIITQRFGDILLDDGVPRKYFGEKNILTDN